MKLIKLTISEYSKPIFINSARIASFFELDPEETVVSFSENEGDHIVVKETYEQILALINGEDAQKAKNEALNNVLTALQDELNHRRIFAYEKSENDINYAIDLIKEQMK